MPTLQWLDDECNNCSRQLNSWDTRLSRALAYKFTVCETCIAKEYDMDVTAIRTYFEEVFSMRPCIGL